MSESINDKMLLVTFFNFMEIGSIIMESRLHKNNIKKSHSNYGR